MRSPIYPLSVSEYLEAEAKSEFRHEYVGGEVFAMAGASRKHNLIAGNIYSRLRSHLRGGGCDAFMSDMKVKLKSEIKKKSIFYYPDVVVSCELQTQDQFVLNSPSLIVEVLSPSTEVIDKREKLQNYQTILSLQEYVLVAQDQVHMEIYRRIDEENWTRETLGREDKLQLDSVNLTLPVMDIYEDVF